MINKFDGIPDIPNITTTKTIYQEGDNITINWDKTEYTTRYLIELYYGEIGILSISSKVTAQ